MQQVVTFISFEIKSGTTARGAWSFHIFKDAGGNKFQTDFNSPLGQIGQSLVGQRVSVVYDIVQKGDFQNNVIKSIVPENEQQQAIPTAQSNEVTPVTHGSTPPAPVALPQPSPVNGDARQTIINRSAALARAIEAHASGIAIVSTPEQLGEIADVFVKYIETGSMA